MSIFAFKDKKNTEPVADPRVFSVLLSETTIQALFWEVVDGDHIEIVAESELKYYGDQNDGLIKLDECLQELGPESETVSKAFFHLDSAFSDQAGLLPEKKDFLQFLTKSLNLEAVGFAANLEALAQLLKSPVDQLFVEYTTTASVWSLFNDGQLVEELQTTGQPGAEEAVWGELKKRITGPIENNLEVYYFSSSLNKAELLTKSELISTGEAKKDFFGAAEILEKVVLPSAVALAKENGWLVNNEEVVAESPVMPVMAPEPVLADEGDLSEDMLADEESAPAATKKPLTKKDKQRRLIAIIIGAVLGALLIAALVFVLVIYNSATAEIVITPKQVTLHENTNIEIDSTVKTSDFEKLVLAGNLIKEEYTDNAQGLATGKKKVGEKATGKVKVINKELSKDRQLTKGTVLTAVDSGLNFVINDDMSVKGAVDEGAGSKYTEEPAGITAVDVGSESNLPIGTKMKVGGFNTTEMEAEVIENLSGGISEDVTVVTESDQKKMADELQAQILANAEKEISRRQENNKYFTPLVKSAQAKDKKWSAQVGDETEELTLTMVVELPAISYDAADLQPLAQAVLTKKLPVGYTLTGNQPQLLATAGDEKTNGKVLLQVDVSSQAMAEVKTNDLANEVAGLEEAKAISKIKTLEGVEEVKINYSSSWYQKFFNKLPKKTDRIQITVSAE